ncbi:MAG TPA: mechanosensitive ion channel domain-containing protein, partial [Methylomirabilota bacterium]|nr:mechanosensitive ion channel domain-containing protein [Methylomirabilota bacterium]
AMTRLRALEPAAATRAEVDEIERRLPAVSEDVRSRQQSIIRELGARLPDSMLDNLAAPIQSTRTLVAGWAETLARHATQAERELGEVGELRQVWQATKTEARRTGAPSAVLSRIDATLAAIAGVEAQVRERRARVLLIQDRVYRERETVEGVMARITGARARSQRPLLSRDGLPLWRIGSAAASLAEVPRRARELAAADGLALRTFVNTHQAVIQLHVLLWLGLSVGFFVLHRRMPADVADDPSLAEAGRVFRYPFAVALLLALLATPWFYGPLPRAPRTVVALIGVIPVLRIYTVLAPAPLRASFFALTAFFVVERLDDVAEVVPLFDQLVFLTEMAVAIAIIAVITRTRPVEGQPPRVVRALGLAMMGAMVTAFLLAALGYTRLGRLIGSGALSVGYFAMVAQAILRVVLGLIAYALRIRPFTYFRLVRRNRLLIERRAAGILQWLAVLLWVIATLGNLSLFRPTLAALSTALGATVTRGNLSISLGDVLAFAFTVWLSFMISRLVRFVLEEDVFPRLPLARGVPNMVTTLLHYSILLVGLILAIAAMGVDLNRVTILASAFGVGIGFGLQTVVNNFVSGLILLVERSIQVGDVIEMGGLSGEVRSIGIRASLVRTAEGGDVIVPNGLLASERVTNWTLSDRMRRVDLKLRVGIEANPERVLQLLREVCENHPGVLRDPAPLVSFTGVGDNALLFEVYAWTPRIEDSLTLKTSLGLAVLNTLRRDGIEIPLPRLEIRMHEATTADLAARGVGSPAPPPNRAG